MKLNLLLPYVADNGREEKLNLCGTARMNYRQWMVHETLWKTHVGGLAVCLSLSACIISGARQSSDVHSAASSCFHVNEARPWCPAGAPLHDVSVRVNTIAWNSSFVILV